MQFTCMYTWHVNVLVHLLFLFFTESFALVIGGKLDMHSLHYSPEIPSVQVYYIISAWAVIPTVHTIVECWASPCPIIIHQHCLHIKVSLCGHIRSCWAVLSLWGLACGLFTYQHTNLTLLFIIVNCSMLWRGVHRSTQFRTPGLHNIV